MPRLLALFWFKSCSDLGALVHFHPQLGTAVLAGSGVASDSEVTLSGLLPLSWWEQRVRCKVRQNRLSALLAAVPNPCPHLLSAQEMPPAPSKPSGWGTRWPKSVSSCTRARSWQDPQSPHLSSSGSYPLREGVEAAAGGRREPGLSWSSP